MCSFPSGCAPGPLPGAGMRSAAGPARPPGTGTPRARRPRAATKERAGLTIGPGASRQVGLPAALHLPAVVAIHRLGEPERHPRLGHLHRALEQRPEALLLLGGEVV